METSFKIKSLIRFNFMPCILSIYEYNIYLFFTFPYVFNLRFLKLQALRSKKISQELLWLSKLVMMKAILISLVKFLPKYRAECLKKRSKIKRSPTFQSL